MLLAIRDPDLFLRPKLRDMNSSLINPPIILLPRGQIEVDHVRKVVHGQMAQSLSVCLSRVNPSPCRHGELLAHDMRNDILLSEIHRGPQLNHSW